MLENSYVTGDFTSYFNFEGCSHVFLWHATAFAVVYAFQRVFYRSDCSTYPVRYNRMNMLFPAAELVPARLTRLQKPKNATLRLWYTLIVIWSGPGLPAKTQSQRSLSWRRSAGTGCSATSQKQGWSLQSITMPLP